MIITALPKIAESLGAPRVVKSSYITATVGDPGLNAEDENKYRKELVLSALKTLTTKM